MGVYGMLAIAMGLFFMRNVMRPGSWKEKGIVAGFWGLNIGLMEMIFVTLLPVGVMQAMESFRHGFWSARSPEFYQQPLVHRLLWLRIVPDLIFIFAGIVPLVGTACYGFLQLRRPAEAGRDVAEPERLIEV